MFQMQTDEVQKVLLLTVWGTYTSEVAFDFIKSFNSAASKLNSPEYILVIDCTDLAVSTYDMVPILREVLKIYMQYPFRKRVAIKMKCPVALAQAQLLAQEAGTDIEFVPSLQEAYAIINK